ncbi:hypothetical protein MMC24_000057 [Lignoscripta atroalba]|nr:hypothetical protein [Lignoscripta atroalba]
MSSNHQVDASCWATSAEEEEQDIANAIAASLDHDSVQIASNTLINKVEQAQNGTRPSEIPLVGATNTSGGKADATITKDYAFDQNIEDVAMNLALELPLLQDPTGDTYIYIDPPPRQPEQDYNSYQRSAARNAAPLRVHKQKFLALNSSFFEKAFGYTAQHRILRRRGLVGKLPPGVKYVLDLTPPTEGEEAVYITTQLCCSEGVRKWFMAGQRWHISKTLIGGREEFAPNLQNKKPSQELASPDRGSKAARKSVDGDGAQPLIPLEYSPIRHRCAIERVVTAIEGHDPQLDSAPKVWTTFAVAKYFEISHSPLTDYIVRWLRAAPNTHFLEVLPEVSLKMADGLQCYDLCRDTFAILVGEEALANMCRSRNLPGLNEAHSIHGRKRDSVPEIYQTRIEYASKAFVERITARFKELVDADLCWLNSLPEFRKLVVHPPCTLTYEDAMGDLIKELKAFIRGAVYYILCSDNKEPVGHRSNNGHSKDLFPQVSAYQLWNRLHPRERIFTRDFWLAVDGGRWSYADSNYQVGRRVHVPQGQWSDAATDTFSCSGSRITMRSILDNLLKRCQNLSRQAQNRMVPESDVLEYLAPASPKHGVDADMRMPLESPKKRRLSRLLAFNSTSSVAQQFSKDATTSLPIRTVKPLSITKSGEAAPQVFQAQGLPGTTPAIGFGQNTASTGIVSNSKRRRTLSVLLTNAIVSPPLQPFDMDRAASTFFPDDWPKPPSHSERTADSPNITPQNTPPRQSRTAGPRHLSSLDIEQMEDDMVERFSIDSLFSQVHDHIGRLCQQMLALPDAGRRSGLLELNVTSTLVCLEDSEWKYLPLWAGGNDDGSGGVFDDNVPIAETGFSTAGPKVHTGAGSSTASDDFELVGSQSDGSTYHTSTVVNDGYTDTMDRRRVFDADSVFAAIMANKERIARSQNSRIGDDTTMESDSTWDQVMTPVEEMEEELQLEKKDKGKGEMVQNGDTYDDLFAQESDDDNDFDDDNDDEFGYIKDTKDRKKDKMKAVDNTVIVYRMNENDDEACRP